MNQLLFNTLKKREGEMDLELKIYILFAVPMCVYIAWIVMSASCVLCVHVSVHRYAEKFVLRAKHFVYFYKLNRSLART